MKFFLVILIFLIFPLFVSAECPEVNQNGLVYCQDFEGIDDWTDAFRGGAWNIPNPDLVQKVSYNCHTGNNCIRGNLRSTVIDPITNTSGIPNQQFEWAPGTSGMDEVFFRYWYRLDDALWSGIADNGDPIIDYNGKLLYITDEVESTRAYFMGGLGSTFAQNGAYTDYYTSHPELWGQYYELGGRTNFYGFNTDRWYIPPSGEWHKVEIYSNHIENYIKVWLDDYLFVSSNADGPTDGLIDTYPDFVMRGLQFWYVRDSYLSTSIDEPETAGSFEIDDLEMWDYNVKEDSSVAPVITSVSGDIMDGNNIVISGDKFGESPEVIIFDDFESGDVNERIKTGINSSKYGQWSNISNTGSEYYGDTISLSGNLSFSSNYNNFYANWIEAEMPVNTKNLFISWWLYLPLENNWPGETSQYGINWKQMWIQGSNTTDDDLVVPTRLGSWVINGNDQDPGYINWTTVDMKKGEWKRLWIWLKGSTSSNSSDGEVKFWELTDSGVIQREDDIGINNLKEGGSWDRVRPNGYGRQTSNCITSFDDIYIAVGENAQARVELGNASTYDNSTNLTILTPLSWSNNQITTQINQGSFNSDGDVFLYVFNQDGLSNQNGYPVNIVIPNTATRVDVNQDSKINTIDAMLVLRNALGLDMTNTTWQESDTTGDVNCDNTSTTTDAMLLLRYSLDLDMAGTEWCE